MKIGDKLSGRHGNKGIISKVLKQHDMPYLQDGTIIDIVLNPLGIPSRMNVGQLFEVLLSFSGNNLKEKYFVKPFLGNYQSMSSLCVIYQKLFEARYITGKKWIFNRFTPGKIKILSGFSGNFFQQEVTIGYSYIIRLMHLSVEKINVRSQSSYSLIINQPLKGKSKRGGQRLGELEIWAVEAFGCAYLLQEMVTLKSDDLSSRYKLLKCILDDISLPKVGIPEAFKVFLIELKSIGISTKLYLNS